MPTPTTRLGLSKPLGNETVNRAAYNAVLDEIDAAVAGLAVVNEFLADQGIGARGTADATNTGYDSFDDYLQGSVWDGSASAPRYRRFVRRVRATPSASYLQMAYQAEGSAEVTLIEISAAGALRPATDGGGSLGEASRRWGAAYVQTLDISASAVLANTAYLKAKDSGGTARNVIGVDASNVLQIGDAGLPHVKFVPSKVTVGGDADAFLNLGSGTRGSVIASNAGFSGNYNAVWIAANERDNKAQANPALPSWAIDLGGYDKPTIGGGDAFAIRRRAPGAAWSQYAELLRIDATGAMLVRGRAAIGSAAVTMEEDRALQVDHPLTSTGSMHFGAVIRARKTGAGTPDLRGIYVHGYVDGVAVTNFVAVDLPTPTLVNGGSISKYFAFGIGTPYNQTTVGPAGNAATLPSRPEGYIRVNVAGVEGVIPWYRAA